jgi:hypothetical protein
MFFADVLSPIDVWLPEALVRIFSDKILWLCLSHHRALLEALGNNLWYNRYQSVDYILSSCKVYIYQFSFRRPE